ncbi:hypothetical protein AAU61_17025 [Desulfocarbo indianensis]|nr:hypothetical protein AAU61_17025 [Desulfocarbo indianensis]
MQEPQDFCQSQRSRDSSYEMGANGLTCQYRNAAAIQVTISQKLFVSRLFSNYCFGLAALPDFGCFSLGWQCVEPHGSEIIVAMSKPGLDH